MDLSNITISHALEPGQLEQEIKPVIVPTLGGLLVVLVLAKIIGKFIDSA